MPGLLPQAGEGAMPGPLSRLRERVGVRAFACRNDFASQALRADVNAARKAHPNRTAWIGGRCVEIAVQRSPASSLDHRLPVVLPISRP